jgi:dynein heavy chain
LDGQWPIYEILAQWLLHTWFPYRSSAEFARKYRIPIDTICFEFICLPKQGDHEKIPEDGVYIYGMFLEGARWDNEHMMLAESFDKVTATIQHSQSALTLTQLAKRILICRKL